MKLIFTFLLTALFTIGIDGQEFVLTTSANNVISSKASIARPGLDGNPQAIIVATPLGDTATSNPHAIGAWYYKGKWNIFNTDHAVMPVNMRYKVEYSLKPDDHNFLHVVTERNLGDEGSYLDHPLLNGHPNAQFKILQNYAPDDRAGYSLNASEAKANYNAAAGKWYIANVNGKRLYPNTAYSVSISSDGKEGATALTPATPINSAASERSTATAPGATTTSTASQPAGPRPSANGTAACTKEMAEQTVGKWGRQKKDDLAMADRTFPKEQHKAVLAKAQKVIELFMRASPEFAGIEAAAQRTIRGESYVPNGALPFRVDIGYNSFICVGSDTYVVEKRDQIIRFGNYNFTTVRFNDLNGVLESVREGTPLLTTTGEEIFEYKRDLGDFKGMTMIEPLVRDEDRHEAVIITMSDRLPYRPLTREEFLQARIKDTRSRGGSFAQAEATVLTTALANMSLADRSAAAIVRDANATLGRVKLFATEAEGGRHLVTIVNSYFDPKLPRDAIQLITIEWNWSPQAAPKIAAVKQLKENFDFAALKQMLGN